MHFSTSFELSLIKKPFFWKLKPLSAGRYTSHTLVLENKPPTKLSSAGVGVCVSKTFQYMLRTLEMFQKCMAFCSISETFLGLDDVKKGHVSLQ